MPDKSMYWSIARDVYALEVKIARAASQGVDVLSPEIGLTTEEKDRYKIIQEAQKTVKIYTSESFYTEESYVGTVAYDPKRAINKENRFEIPPGTLGFSERLIDRNDAEFVRILNASSPEHASLPIVGLTKKEYQKLRELGYIAEDSQDDSAKLARAKSKFKVIFSEVPHFFPDGTYEMVPMITANAPNFFSSQADQAKYLRGGELKRVRLDDGSEKIELINAELNEKAYQATCQEIANLILFAAKDNGLTQINVADFGLGIYLSSVVGKDKVTAKKLMRTAFLEAAERYKVKVNWILYGREAAVAAGELNQHLFAGKQQFIEAKAGDITAVKGCRAASIGVLNNGSDRTIGGARHAFSDASTGAPRPPGTTEEQVAQQSFLIVVQSKFNPYMAACCNSKTVTKVPSLTAADTTHQVARMSSHGAPADVKGLGTAGVNGVETPAAQAAADRETSLLQMSMPLYPEKLINEVQVTQCKSRIYLMMEQQVRQDKVLSPEDKKILMKDFSALLTKAEALLLSPSDDLAHQKGVELMRLARSFTACAYQERGKRAGYLKQYADPDTKLLKQHRGILSRLLAWLTCGLLGKTGSYQKVTNMHDFFKSKMIEKPSSKPGVPPTPKR